MSIHSSFVDDLGNRIIPNSSPADSLGHLQSGRGEIPSSYLEDHLAASGSASGAPFIAPMVSSDVDPVAILPSEIAERSDLDQTTKDRLTNLFNHAKSPDASFNGLQEDRRLLLEMLNGPRPKLSSRQASEAMRQLNDAIWQARRRETVDAAHVASVQNPVGRAALQQGFDCLKNPSASPSDLKNAMNRIDEAVRTGALTETQGVGARDQLLASLDAKQQKQRTLDAFSFEHEGKLDPQMIRPVDIASSGLDHQTQVDMANAFDHAADPTSSLNGLKADLKAIDDDVKAGKLNERQAAMVRPVLQAAIGKAEGIHDESQIATAGLDSATQTLLKNAFRCAEDPTSSKNVLSENARLLERAVDDGALTLGQAKPALDRLVAAGITAPLRAAIQPAQVDATNLDAQTKAHLKSIFAGAADERSTRQDLCKLQDLLEDDIAAGKLTDAQAAQAQNSLDVALRNCR